jgi:hypothetical protein
MLPHTESARNCAPPSSSLARENAALRARILELEHELACAERWILMVENEVDELRIALGEMEIPL